MKRLIYTVCALFFSAITYGQAKLAQDSTAGANLQSSPSIQWSRNLLYGKPLYYVFDAKTGKTLPIYSAQLTNYIFLGKQEAAGLYQQIGNYYKPGDDIVAHSLSLATTLTLAYNANLRVTNYSGQAFPAVVGDYSGNEYFGNPSVTTTIQGSQINLANNGGVIVVPLMLSGNLADSVVVHDALTRRIRLIAPATPFFTFAGNTVMARGYRGETAVQLIYLGGGGSRKIALGSDSALTALYIQNLSSTIPSARLKINGTALTAHRIVTFRDQDVTVASTTDPVSTFTNDAGYQTQAIADGRYVSVNGGYLNPPWISSLAYNKLTGTGTGVAPGSYTNANITVGSDGRITFASNGSGGGISQATADGRYVSLTGSYANPSWLTSLTYSKLTGAPTNVSSFTNDANYTTIFQGSTTISGTSGSVVVSMPFRDGAFKKVFLYFTNYRGNGSYTFPIAFTNTPIITAIANAYASDGFGVTSTGVNFVDIGQIINGPVILEGY